MILSGNMLKTVVRVDIPVDNSCSEAASHDAVEEDCTGGLVTEVFDDSGKVGNDVVLHGCPQSCIPNPVEGLLKVYEDMVEVLLVLKIFFTEDW